MDEAATPDPVPPILWSAYLDAPFRSCSVCGADLLRGTVPYQVQKAFRSGQVVFEMALCAPCAGHLLREFSKESMERMQQFFKERFHPLPTVEVCHFCSKAIVRASEYEAAGTCAGSGLLHPVVVVCADCNAAVQQRLSVKTRDAWGGFVERNFPGVPDSLSPETTPFLM